MNIIHTQALVIGGGLAGLRTAVGIKERGHDVIVISLIPAKRSHSAAAQGGMQASLANSFKSQGDNEDVHFEDTVKGSDWGCDQIVARMFAHCAPKAIRQLSAWGVPWSRVKKGEKEVTVNAKKVTITESEEAHGLITSRDFGGTKKWRTCYTSDGTGHSMLYAMDNKAIQDGIRVDERQEALALIHDGNRCYGAIVRDLITGKLSAYIAKATVIATGGYGRLYKVSTNAIICEGIGAALALETGIAQLGNMEAVQFHPTAIVPVGILTTEGCRGDGGLIKDVDGYRFMPDYEPEKKELASRDVVSRRMTEHMRKGKGVPSPYGDHLWLDITILGRKHVEKNLREVHEICKYFLGIDAAKDYIPVRPTQHYSMGGIKTKPTGESPTLRGLYSCGESACWDMHGFNRLGGNSVAETVVSGMIISEFIADFLDSSESDINLSSKIIEDFYKEENQKIDTLLSCNGGENTYELRDAMEEIMMQKVGIFRNGDDLTAAVDELEALLKRSYNISVRSKLRSSNPELVHAYRTQKMLKIALCAAIGARDRTESRGAHTREDYPQRDDSKWLNRTLTTWVNNNDTLPTVSYEDLDIMTMELPPGFRGYGVKNNIDHPNTAKRMAEIADITKNLKNPDRFNIQEALMPFKQYLPDRYRERNERLVERFSDKEVTRIVKLTATYEKQKLIKRSANSTNVSSKIADTSNVI